jgi:hypothetical protein
MPIACPLEILCVTCTARQPALGDELKWLLRTRSTLDSGHHGHSQCDDGLAIDSRTTTVPAPQPPPPSSLRREHFLPPTTARAAGHASAPSAATAGTRAAIEHHGSKHPAEEEQETHPATAPAFIMAREGDKPAALHFPAAHSHRTHVACSTKPHTRSSMPAVAPSFVAHYSMGQHP